MSDKPWKRHERAVARVFETERQGPAFSKGADALTPFFAIQCKHREDPFPKWLAEAVEQATRDATDGRIGITVFHHKGDVHEDDLVVIPLGKFARWTSRL